MESSIATFQHPTRSGLDDAMAEWLTAITMVPGKACSTVSARDHKLPLHGRANNTTLIAAVLHFLDALPPASPGAPFAVTESVPGAHP
ncbi:hypothetical protein [Xanthomonas sp. MUS 060]|uniref:hypothetical protein n=1 Tax=Xanthomonas sp. MUS 060 TaxID=1588031 RepID=UPI0005F2A36A|nr:hypothetical protein [Xanthomonas sp. MUS 060]